MSSRRIQLATSLRQRSGLAEQRIWAILRAGRVDGLKFRRQHPIGAYVVDFACDSLRLVIEIDGGVHGRDDVALNDHYRQTEIEALGWTVLRFGNQTALETPDRIVDAIRAHVRLVKADPHPPAQPS